MPNRFIKESIGTSETLALISGDEERHFWRLVVQADDFGRFDARPHVIRSRGYSAMLGKVSEEESERRTLALDSAGLITLYENDGKRYGYFTTWQKHQQTRSHVSKFPDPLADDSSRYQAQADALVSVSVSVSVLESESVNVDEGRRPQRASSPWKAPDWFRPLMGLEGYKKGNRSQAALKIAEACTIKSIEKERVIATFVEYWPIGRLKHDNWHEPVASLLRTVDVQIDKARSDNGKSRPGSEATGEPSRFDDPSWQGANR